jgi:hypothetical protein
MSPAGPLATSWDPTCQRGCPRRLEAGGKARETGSRLTLCCASLSYELTQLERTPANAAPPTPSGGGRPSPADLGQKRR